MKFSYKNILKYTVAVAVAVCPLCMNAQEESIAEAEILMKSGDTDNAITMLRHLERKTPKNGKINMLMGDCYADIDSVERAKEEYRKATKKGENEAWLSFATLAIRDYRISDAEEDIELYRKGLKKGRKTLPDNSGDVTSQLEKTRSMLARVEKIVIIDSINVEADNFLLAYRLSPESGALLPAEVLPDDVERAYPTAVYASESGSNLIWAAPDTTQTYHLVTTSQLYGGEWETPKPLNGDLGQGGDANFPYLLQDGITLYFASNGENSLGGYDIFISRRNGTEYLTPQNVGMPYNSPYNDYMLAIDESTGVGWWATDRNKIPGMVTIYVFIPTDMRINYDIDDPTLASKAKIDSYRDTWQDGEDYAELLAKIAAIKPKKREKKAEEFMLNIPGIGVYTSLDDFKSNEAKLEMSQYLSSSRAVTQAKEKLAALRLRYADGETTLAREILAWEERIAKMQSELKKTKNGVITMETRAN